MKRMKLIDESLYNRLMTNCPSTTQQDIKTKTSNLLNEHIANILSSSDPHDERIKLYNSALASYIQKEKKPEEQPKPALSDEKIIAAIPLTYQPKAQKLLHHIRGNTQVSWDDTGQIVIAGQKIKNSNIAELTKDIVRNIKNPENPIGKDRLLEELVKTNVNPSLIGKKRYIDEVSPKRGKEVEKKQSKRKRLRSDSVVTRSKRIAEEKRREKELAIKNWMTLQNE